MSRGPLCVSEFQSPSFHSELFLDQIAKAFGRAGEDGMTEGIEAGFVRGNFLTSGIFQSLSHHHDAEIEAIDSLFDPRKEGLLVQENLRNQDYMRRILGRSSCQDRAGGNPASAPAHDLDDAATALLRRHAA